MSLKTEAIKKFLTAARSLANQGMSKEAIMNFARNEFGEISELFQKQIDKIFKPGQGIKSVKMKDPDFDDTVVEMQFDEFGPFNPKDPLKNLKKQTKPKKAGKGQFTKAEYLIQRLKNTIKENPDDKYVQENFSNFVKEIEANPDLAKNENVFRELGGDLPSNQKITVYDDDTLDFLTLKPTKKFQLNKEKFKQDFNVTDDEVERITKLSSDEQQKKLQKYIDKDFKERIELSDYDVTDLEPNAEGGIVGYYTGGMVDVEPNLSDIGHGSDALMARTRLMSPGSQATTSTGLNYLLAEDNDNIRVPFSKGKIAKELLDKGRRGFMKAAGGIGAGIAGLKSGLLGFGKEAAPVAEKAVETVSETAQGVPPYFLNLVKKIKNLGDETLASQDKAIAKKYKDYVMEEDFAGNITIIKKNMDDPYPTEVIMSYKVDDVSLPSGKGMAKVDEYEEFTVRPDGDGKMKDIEGGVPDEVIEEGTMFEDNITDFKKASGGLAKLLGE